MSESDLIQHISDTSLWIAAYRAQESARPDAIFSDPLAARLAGSRGVQMVAATPHTRTMSFAMAMRTSAIDRLIHLAISKGIDTVINLGAGLDTRPYRMQLPAHLKWIEVDFANIIDYKTELLKTEKPVCNLQRISSDLSIQMERLDLFTSLDAYAKKSIDHYRRRDHLSYQRPGGTIVERPFFDAPFSVLDTGLPLWKISQHKTVGAIGKDCKKHTLPFPCG